MTSLSIAASVVSASAAPTTSSTSALVKTANGEYTAASVQQDPTDAAKLGLSKQKDGNYGTGQAGATATSQASSTTASAATRSSSATQAALATLTLGGS